MLKIFFQKQKDQEKSLKLDFACGIPSHKTFVHSVNYISYLSIDYDIFFSKLTREK